MTRRTPWLQKSLKLLPLAAVVGAIVLALHHFGTDSLLKPESLSDRIAANGAMGIALFLVVFIVAGCVVPPIIFVIASGLLWPFPQALATAFTGSLGAAFLGFFISRHTARDFFSRHIPARLQAYSDGIRRHGLETTITLRLLFFLFPPVNWLLGISRIKIRDYLLGTVLGCIPGMLFYTYIGQGWIPWLLEKPLTRSAMVLGALAGGVAAGVLIRHSLKRRRGPDDQGPTLTTKLFLNSLQMYVTLCFTTFLPPAPHPKPSPRRILVMLLFLPAFALLMLVHWTALFLDEILFPRYRGIRVQNPLFIVGIPRSGTTHLHRVLAQDTDRFTTLRLWQVLLAPAICERKLLHALARIDRHLGRPLDRLVNWTLSKFSDELGDIHHLSLRQPEEDFVLLMPVLACFILVAAFPQSESIADLARFDTELSEKHRRQIMAFYRGMLQRHLHCVGTARTLLSKNVSFTPMLESLLDTFPDARIVACVREPERTVPSQISAMEHAWKSFGNPVDSPDFRKRWLDLIEHYCLHLIEVLDKHPPERVQCLHMDELKNNIESAVTRLYSQFGMQPSADFTRYLAQERETTRNYQSRHRYSLEDYGLDNTEISHRFNDAWQRLRPKQQETAP